VWWGGLGAEYMKTAHEYMEKKIQHKSEAHADPILKFTSLTTQLTQKPLTPTPTPPKHKTHQKKNKKKKQTNPKHHNANRRQEKTITITHHTTNTTQTNKKTANQNVTT